MKVDEIKVLLKSGDIAGAEAAAKAGLENDKDNFRLLMLYGTCRQLLGDEATFRDTYAVVKAALDANEIELDAVTADEWKLFEMLHRNLDQPELLRKGEQPHRVLKMEYVVLALLIVVAVGVAVYWFGNGVKDQMEVARCALTAYAGPPAQDNLYAGPKTDEMEKRKSSAARAQRFKDTERKEHCGGVAGRNVRDAFNRDVFKEMELEMEQMKRRFQKNGNQPETERIP